MSSGLECCAIWLCFKDKYAERGFLSSRRDKLTSKVLQGIAAALVYLLLTILLILFVGSSSSGGVFKDTDEGRQLGKLRNIVIFTMAGSFALLLLPVRYFSAASLEVCVTCLACVVAIFLILEHPWYLAKLCGIPDPWAHIPDRSISNDNLLLLHLDLGLTACHLMMPIRWMMLWPVDVLVILCYVVPAVLLGSPLHIFCVGLNSVMIVLFVVMASLGKRMLEIHERHAFAQVAVERTMRAEAEFKLAQCQESNASTTTPTSEQGKDDMSSSTSISLPDTLHSACLPCPAIHECRREEILEMFVNSGSHDKLPGHEVPQAIDTYVAALELMCDHALGGALVCIADAEAFQQVFAAGDQDSGGGQPCTRSSDQGYMTASLRGIHITDPRFREAFREFTRHTSNDCWPSDHPDESARGRPKDGAFLLSRTGYRVQCSAKLLGLAPVARWANVGTKHEAALACAWAVPGSVVFVRSDRGTLHLVAKQQDKLHVYHLSDGD